MALHKLVEGLTWTAEAGADLRTHLNKFVTINANGEAVLPSSGAAVVGTIYEVNLSGSAPYGPVTIQLGGVAKVVAGGTISAGQEVEVGANGTAVAKTSGVVVGIALASGASGEVIPVLLK